jgi:hypothetical protein
MNHRSDWTDSINFIYVFRFLNVDLVYLHGTFYVSIIIVQVRSGGVYKYDSFMSVLIISLLLCNSDLRFFVFAAYCVVWHTTYWRTFCIFSDFCITLIQRSDYMVIIIVRVRSGDIPIQFIYLTVMLQFRFEILSLRLELYDFTDNRLMNFMYIFRFFLY